MTGGYDDSDDDSVDDGVDDGVGYGDDGKWKWSLWRNRNEGETLLRNISNLRDSRREPSAVRYLVPK